MSIIRGRHYLAHVTWGKGVCQRVTFNGVNVVFLSVVRSDMPTSIYCFDDSSNYIFVGQRENFFVPLGEDPRRERSGKSKNIVLSKGIAKELILYKFVLVDLHCILISISLPLSTS